MAFNCIMDEKCPKHNEMEQNGCPCWWQIPWENTETGEQTVKSGCILSQEMGLPIVQVIVRAAHVSSEHASKARNSTDKLNDTIQAVTQYAIQRREQERLPNE